MNRQYSGFSLIEMAIVLIIFGLVGGMFLPTLKAVIDWQKNSITTQNQEKIFYALASYALQNKVLPCATDPKNVRGTQEKGRRRGIVPYGDLGLPASIAKDGYQRWFTYVVDDYYTILPNLNGPLHSSLQPKTKLCDSHKHSNSLQIKGKAENIALALISHGPEGRGAFPPLNTLPISADELQNASSEIELIDRPFSSDPSNPFSHKIMWITAKNLLALYGHAPCPSSDTLNPTNMRLEPPQNPF